MSTPKDNHQSKSFAFESSPEFLLYSDPKLSLITSQYATKATLFQSANSIVYLVNHQETEKPYTLKAIRKMAGVNFDFSTFQQLDHPNLIPLTEHIESEHFHILIKPYVPGIDLHTYVQQNGPLRGEALNALIDQLTSAIAYLHTQEKALIFRDLKPSNVIVTETPLGLLFTIIDIETMRKTQTDKTSDTYFVLSHGFSSPEQYGYQQSDPRSDIYSLGATLFYAMTGEKPDHKMNIYRHLVKHPMPVNRVTALAIEKCLAFDPTRRHHSVHKFRRALKRPNILSMLKKDGLVASLAFALIIVFSIAFGYANAILGENDPTRSTTMTGSALETEKTLFTEPSGETEVSPETEPSQETEPTEETDPFEKTDRTGEIESSNENESSSENLSEVFKNQPDSTTETIKQTSTEATTQPITQPTTLPASTTTTESSVDDYPIIGRSEGVILIHLSGTQYRITINPNNMPSGQENVAYMSVYSVQTVPDSAEIKQLSNDAVTKGYGFHPFDYRTGYGSILSGNHYLVLLYDDNSKLLGYRIFENVKSTTSSISGSGNAGTEERLVKVAEGVTLDVRATDMTLYVDPSKLPADQKDLASVVIMGNVMTGDQKQLDNIIEEIEVLGRYMRPYRSTGVNSGYGGLTFDTQSWYIIFVNSQQKVTRVISVN